jgi:hypothetical protein
MSIRGGFAVTGNSKRTRTRQPNQPKLHTRSQSVNETASEAVIAQRRCLAANRKSVATHMQRVRFCEDEDLVLRAGANQDRDGCKQKIGIKPREMNPL